MVRHPLAVIAINPPDGDRRTHHIFGDIARQTLVLRGDCALLHVGHETVGILRETRIHQPVAGLRLERLTHHAQQIPLPLTTQQRIGQILVG